MPLTVRCASPACNRLFQLTQEPDGQPVLCPDCGCVCTPAAPAATLDLPADGAAIGVPAPPATPSLPPAAGPCPEGGRDNLPERIGRFEVRQRLGEGAFGVVYRAYDPHLEREVALKVAKPEQLGSEQRQALPARGQGGGQPASSEHRAGLRFG
jgi:hypothetical protein